MEKVLIAFDRAKDKVGAVGWQAKRAVAKQAGIDLKPVLVKNPLLDWPRNNKCVCGSGKKFKKCCLNTLSRQVTMKDAKMINEKLQAYRI